MNFRDFRVGWRHLAQEPAYSLVVVLGLSVGLAACLLLLGFVGYSWQYNAQVPDVDNVYVVKQRYNVDPKASWFDLAPLMLRNVASNTPGVVGATAYIPSRPLGQKISVRAGDHFRLLNTLTVIPGFAETLGLQTVEGDVAAALTQPDSFAITEQAALEIFGTAHAIDRTVHTDGKVLRVAAILRDPPANTTIPFESLVGVNSVLGFDELNKELLTGEQGWDGKVLIHVKPGASLPAITEALQQAVDSAPAYRKIPPELMKRLGNRKVIDIKLSPLRYAYFDRDVGANYVAPPGDRANPVAIAGLAVIAILILALAAINYVNLATVRVLRRQREIGMRKVLGAGVRRIALQFLIESLLVTMLATGLGLLLAWLALPVFSELMNRKLEGMLSIGNLAVVALIGVLLGTFCSLYPAWIAIRIRPTQVLAGRPDSETMHGKNLRRLLTMLQISTAMGLAGVTLAIAWQTSFAMHASPGFDPNPLLIVDLPDPAFRGDRTRGFMAELSRQSGIAGIAIAHDAVGRSLSPWHSSLNRDGGAPVAVEWKAVSANFFEQFGIQPLAGRLFYTRIDQEDDPAPLVINAMAARDLGFASPEAAIGQFLLFNGGSDKNASKRIVGIAPDLRFQSMRETPSATAYGLSTKGDVFTVRITSPFSEIEPVIQAVWLKYFPDTLVEVKQEKDVLAVNYEEDARLAKLLSAATGIALTIAAFGTYVLSAHTVQRRAKEIVLRKLYGARSRDVAQLVVKEIGILTLVSAAIGLPIAAIAIQHYLAGYVEHAPIGYWTLLCALVAALAIALIAVARHAWIAMRMAPTAILRD